MNSGKLAIKRLKNAIFRDRQDMGSVSINSLKEEFTLLTAEFFDVEEHTAEISSQKSDDGRRVITYSVKIK